MNYWIRKYKHNTRRIALVIGASIWGASIWIFQLSPAQSKEPGPVVGVVNLIAVFKDWSLSNLALKRQEETNQVIGKLNAEGNRLLAEAEANSGVSQQEFDVVNRLYKKAESIRAAGQEDIDTMNVLMQNIVAQAISEESSDKHVKFVFNNEYLASDGVDLTDGVKRRVESVVSTTMVAPALSEKAQWRQKLHKIYPGYEWKNPSESTNPLMSFVDYERAVTSYFRSNNYLPSKTEGTSKAVAGGASAAVPDLTEMQRYVRATAQSCALEGGYDGVLAKVPEQTVEGPDITEDLIAKLTKK